MRARLLRVRGRVQGVGYRDWLLRLAASHGLDGWVRNRADGSVEALLSGEEAAIGQVLALCRRGPMLARVDALEESFTEPAAEPGFRRMPNA